MPGNDHFVSRDFYESILCALWYFLLTNQAQVDVVWCISVKLVNLHCSISSIHQCFKRLSLLFLHRLLYLVYCHRLFTSLVTDIWVLCFSWSYFWKSQIDGLEAKDLIVTRDLEMESCIEPIQTDLDPLAISLA